MSLTDKETHQKDEVLFSGSMRHRKLPRARRRKKRTPEITAQPVGMIDPLTGEITVSDEADNFPVEDTSISNKGINSQVEDDLLWTDLDDAEEVRTAKGAEEFRTNAEAEENWAAEETEEIQTSKKAEEIQTVAKAKEMRKAADSDEDMFLADIKDEDTEVESEDDPDDDEQAGEESSGRFSLSNIFKRTRTEKKKKKKSQSRRKKAPTKGKKKQRG